MKIAYTIVRILLGALMLFASIAYFFKLVDEEPPTGDMATFAAGLAASKYMFPLVKAIELVVGMALVSGKFVRLAAVVLFPITVNILLIHVFLTPEQLPIAILVLLTNLFLLYYHWDSYKEMVKA